MKLEINSTKNSLETNVTKRLYKTIYVNLPKNEEKKEQLIPK